MDFVFIDRSFSSIDKVVEHTYGTLAQYTLKFLTFFGWEFDATKNYIYADTYKVIASDPRDELIPDEASLKNGVTKEIILAEVTRKESRLSIGPNKRREAKAVNFDKYCHIINKEETEGFFEAVKYLYDMVLKYASSDTQRRSKRVDKGDIESATRDSTGSTATLATRGKDNQDPNSPDREDDSETRQLSRESILETNRSLAESELLTDTFDHDDTLDASRGLSLSYTFDNDESSRYDEDREAKKRQRKEKKKKEKKFKFAAIDNSRDPTDYDVLNRFLLRAHKSLDKLDSSGKTLRQIFEGKEAIQFEAFRFFIMNLEIYGSFTPLNDRLCDPQVTRISSYLKVGKVRKGLELLVADYDNFSGSVFKDVLLKTKMIAYYFNKLEAFLSRKHKQSSRPSTGEKMQFCIDYDLEENKEEEKVFENAELESADGEESKYNTPRSGLSVIEDDEDEYYYVKTLFKDFAEPDVNKTGYLIPIT
jgi:hypothetical protein